MPDATAPAAQMPISAMNRPRPAALHNPVLHNPVLHNPGPLYVTGLFSMGYADFYIFLMPLY
jgi:hypothetical protein